MSDTSEIMKKAALIRLAVFDVDGVMTNGEIIYTSSHQEQKVFHVHDGLGLKLLGNSGCTVAIISARSSEIVETRMAELGISHVYQGQGDKRSCMLALLDRLAIQPAAAAYTGDDLVDLPAMRQCGLAIAVANAHPFVKSNADWITSLPGGAGAVREVCELILRAQSRLEPLLDDYLR